MESSVKITKLCEAWWEQFSDSTRADQQQYAERYLSLLGWEELSPIDTCSSDSPLSGVSYVVRAAQTGVGIHFMMPGSLEPPTAIVERGLDFCESTRLLVDGTRRMNIDYAFITDLFRSYLYDAQADELLLYSDTPESFNAELAPVLTRDAVEHGELEQVRREPRSAAARRLRKLCHHWTKSLVHDSLLTKELAFVVIDRLLVLRYLFDHDILKRSGWRLQKRFSEIVEKAFRAEGEDCGKALCALFHDIWFDWKAGMFEPIPKLDEALEKGAFAASLLRDFALLSKPKFSIATILESFNYGEASEKARVRIVPDADEERVYYLAKQTTQSVDEARLEIDVLGEGYRALFYWFDRMVELYDRLGCEFDSRAYNAPEQAADMDLFAWSELDANRPSALRDKFQHAIESGIVVYYASPRQYRTARLLLYLHLISRYKESKQRFIQFPRIEDALVERPSVLASDRNQLYRPLPDSQVDEWDAV